MTETDNTEDFDYDSFFHQLSNKVKEDIDPKTGKIPVLLTFLLILPLVIVKNKMKNITNLFPLRKGGKGDVYLIILFII